MNGSAEELDAIVRGAMDAFWRNLEGSADGSFLVERDSVLAVVNPAVAERSLFNSVMYHRPDDLLAHRSELQSIYDEAGIEAWTVWAPAADADLQAELERQGHVLDSDPDSLVLDLKDLEAPDPGALDWERETDLARLIAINDAAYPWPEGTFARALGRLTAEDWHVYVASERGQPVSCLMTQDSNHNTRPEFVATLPDARGSGLTSRLLGLALRHARERGCSTSTLHASKIGQPVYEKLGYRVLGGWTMWERRRD